MQIPKYKAKMLRQGNSNYVIVPAFITKFLEANQGTEFEVQLKVKDKDSVLWFSTTDPRPAGVV